ncbi:serine hydrolase [uncultured Psychroserpens sp.]|uniref:serine hydrolase domain-containing protein n=1 Tax=uncultured Psychroserpens sp. TaxID=255436 RepID=UPI002621C1FF|nr:serine hydrolase domain-containing protein [uncultured Psychroserpens sp.]
MRNKYIIFALSLIFLLLFNCSQKKKEPLLPKSTFIKDKIDSVGNKFIREGKVMGFSIAVVKNNEILYNNSFGFIDSLKTIPTNNDHYFLMASISKLAGSTMVMKLVEEGILDLDDSLSDLLPDFPNKEQGSKIKLRHLISMTSGLKEYASTLDSIYVATGKSPTKEDYYNFFNSHELEFEPGAYYKYVNSGFVLMAMIVERATKMPFQNSIDRIINEPSGFNIELISSRINNPKMSNHFQLTDSTIRERKHWLWIKGDGGMTNTAIDLAYFPEKWMNGSMISQHSFKQMISPTKLSSGFSSEYGLGVKNGSFEGVKMFGHSGGDKTTYSMMFHFPEVKTTIVTMVNTNNTPSNARQIFSEVALIVLDKKKPNHKLKPLKNEDLSNLVGSYLSPGDKENKTAFIIYNEQDQHLYYTFDKIIENGEKMYNLGNGEFWIERWPFDRIHFVKNDNNKIVALKEFYGGYMSQLKLRMD